MKHGEAFIVMVEEAYRRVFGFERLRGVLTANTSMGLERKIRKGQA
jgi:hypothetical protein